MFTFVLIRKIGADFDIYILYLLLDDKEINELKLIWKNFLDYSIT